MVSSARLTKLLFWAQVKNVKINFYEFFWLSNCFLEFSVQLFGTLQPVPEDNKHRPGSLELDVDYFKVIGKKAPPGGIKSVVNKDSNLDVQLNNWHLMSRGTKVNSYFWFIFLFLNFMLIFII